MKAVAPDRLVTNGTNPGEARRAGIMTGVPHPGGTPPHVVRWLDNGHGSPVVAGPAARVGSARTVGSSS